MAVVYSSDPGLQPERTALAWKRTAIALLGCFLLLVRLSFQTHPGFGRLVLLLAVVSTTMAVIPFRRYRQLKLGIISHTAPLSINTLFWLIMLLSLISLVSTIGVDALG